MTQNRTYSFDHRLYSRIYSGNSVRLGTWSGTHLVSFMAASRYPLRSGVRCTGGPNEFVKDFVYVYYNRVYHEFGGTFFSLDAVIRYLETVDFKNVCCFFSDEQLAKIRKRDALGVLDEDGEVDICSDSQVLVFRANRVHFHIDPQDESFVTWGRSRSTGECFFFQDGKHIPRDVETRKEDIPVWRLHLDDIPK